VLHAHENKHLLGEAMSRPVRLALVISSLALAALASGCAADAGAADEEVESAEDALTRAQCRGARGESDPACRVKGTVEKMIVAEMDPFVVGDACVTFVMVGSRRYGLVRDPAACSSPDRYEGAGVEVSYSKGALVTLSRAKVRVLKDYDANAVYYGLDGPLTEAPASALAAFDALAADAKIATLYDVAPGGTWATLRPGFQQRAVRMLDELSGDTLRVALDAYYELRDDAFQNGGDRPDVFTIERDGVTYAYGMAVSGRSYGNWGTLRIFDRSFDELATFGYAD
jgi:hypothetical protein